MNPIRRLSISAALTTGIALSPHALAAEKKGAAAKPAPRESNAPAAGKPAAPQRLAIVSRSASQGRKIAGLKILIKLLPNETGGPARIQVLGKYRPKKEGYTLTVNLVKVSTNDKGIFSFEVPIDDKWSMIEAIAVSPKGSTESETFEVQIPGGKKSAVAKRHRFSVGLGPTMINYTESFLKPISGTVLTGKASWLYWITPGAWSVSLSAYGTVAALSVTPSDKIPKFLGVNGRIGLLTQVLPKPWSLTLAAGFFYTTMPVPDFGFTHLSGPQVFPVLTRGFTGGHAVTTYFKFSPIAANMAIQSLGNREIAAGLSFTQLLKSGDALLYSVDGAKLDFSTDGAAISNSSLSFSVGYGW